MPLAKLNHWGHRLARLLMEHKMTQSDLARQVWKEERPDGRGYTHVVGKDRINKFVREGAVPSKTILTDIAKALRVTPEFLCPEAYGREPPTEPVMQIDALPGDNLVLLRINQIIDAVIAAEIFDILAKKR